MKDETKQKVKELIHEYVEKEHGMYNIWYNTDAFIEYEDFDAYFKKESDSFLEKLEQILLDEKDKPCKE